jgi:hypothetical protein
MLAGMALIANSFNDQVHFFRLESFRQGYFWDFGIWQAKSLLTGVTIEMDMEVMMLSAITTVLT